MAKRYNLNSKKLYESNSAYVLTVDEYDPNGRRVKDTIEFEEQYQNLDDAIEDTYEIMTNVASDQGINEDDVEYNENNDTVTFTVEGVGKWVFKAVPATNECGDNCDDDDKANECNEDNGSMQESVSARFARLRKMFESDEDEDDNSGKGSDDAGNDDDNQDDANDDNSDDNADDNQEDNKDDENDDEEMKAVILTVKKGDADKCKEELIDANIPEEDIEVIEGDEDAENDEVRVDVNSVMELKDYLAKKGIDLEEEIGGEIVSDDNDDDTDADNTEGGEEGGEEEEFNFDDLGDIFGAEDDEK